MLELRRLAAFLKYDEEAFPGMLAQKTNKEILEEQKQGEATLQESGILILLLKPISKQIPGKVLLWSIFRTQHLPKTKKSRPKTCSVHTKKAKNNRVFITNHQVCYEHSIWSE